MKKFGDRLRKFRKQRGISQRDLAYLVGVDYTYISKLEGGSLLPPSTYTIHLIAHVLDADENELMNLAGKVPDGLKQAIQDNPLLAELVRVLSQRVLPDEVYRQLIAIAKGEEQ